MWLCKIQLKHDCTVSNRMQKYKLMSFITFLGAYKEKGISYAIGMHRLMGEEKKIKMFFKEFKRDPNVLRCQLNKNIMVCTERSTLLPISKFKNQIFFQKPVLVDEKGYEHWEFFSYERELINQFIRAARKSCDFFKIQKLSKTKLTDVYFPHAIPQLTAKQKRAFDLAWKEGYYAIPRKTNIRALAKLMHISKSTCQDLLRRAENKLLPDIAQMQIIE